MSFASGSPAPRAPGRCDAHSVSMLQLRGRRDEAAEDFDEWEEPEYDPSDVLALVNTGDPTDEDLARLFQSMSPGRTATALVFQNRRTRDRDGRA